MGLMPSEFEEIARLSLKEHKLTDIDNLKCTPESIRRAINEFGSQLVDEQSRQSKPLAEAIYNLNERQFRELSGWVLFGRDYYPEDGDPFDQLSRYIREVITEPRDAQSAYLEAKPIGEYLCSAEQHLLGCDQDDCSDELDEDYQ